jgi:hypothetical protein
VCLKHQNHRREIFLRVRTSNEFAAVFVLFVIRGAGSPSARARAAIPLQFQRFYFRSPGTSDGPGNITLVGSSELRGFAHAILPIHPAQLARLSLIKPMR